MLQTVTGGAPAPRVILAGADGALARFEEVLARLDVVVERVGSEDQLVHEASRDEVALVLIHAGSEGDAALKTIHRLRARACVRNVPLLLVCSAAPGALADLDDPRLGIFDVLVEPVHPGLLRAKVRLLVDLTAIRRATRLCADVAAQLGTRSRSAPDRADAFVHLDSVVRDTLDRIVPEVPSGVRLDTALAAGTVEVAFGRERLERVVHGLVSNALEAMACGGALRVATGVEVVQSRAPLTVWGVGRMIGVFRAPERPVGRPFS